MSLTPEPDPTFTVWQRMTDGSYTRLDRRGHIIVNPFAKAATTACGIVVSMPERTAFVVERQYDREPHENDVDVVDCQECIAAHIRADVRS